MTLGKWDNDGELTWEDGDVLFSADLNTTFQEAIVPIGTVVGWMKSISGVPGTLPEGWLECDGSVISDANSPLDGETLPDLNSTQRFLRGSSTSGTTGGSDTNSHTHTGTTNGPSGGANSYAVGSGPYDNHNHTFTTSVPSGSENRPAFYETVFIMRIK